MVACTKAKTNCTRDLEKSVEASYIWLDSCVRQGGALTNGLPFYQRANWPREMSFLSQGQGYPAFVANFTIRQKQVSLFGFSFQLETTLQHVFSTKCPFQRKTCQIHVNQSLMLLKTAVASKRLNLMNSKTGFGKLKNGTKTELDEIPSINCAENAAKCQKMC